MTRHTRIVILLSGLVVGCGRTNEPPANLTAAPASSPAAQSRTAAPPSALTATEWRLVEMQSMDDAQGTTKPADPSIYTMRLDADGSVAMRLNCNRATGSWSASPGPDGTSGTFEFGPLAGTRARCPPPSLDEKITAQAPYVRSYLLKDGRLSLSLMADGGIWIWEPVPAGASTEAAPARGAAASGSLPDAVVALIKKQYSSADMPSRYKAGTSDLNGDGRQELLVHVVGPMACGTGGCPTLLFTPEGAGYTLVSTISVSRPPVRVSPRSSNGWRNLIVEISGGGGRSGHAELAYTGRGYPQNPTVAPARRITDLAGSEIVIDEFASFDAATPLPPG